MSRVANRFTLLFIATLLISPFSVSQIIAGPNADTQIENSPSSGTRFVLRPEFRISEAASLAPLRRNTAVAYNDNQNEYLVAWDNYWPSGHKDIHARRVKSDGQLLHWFPVAVGTDSKYDPAVIYNSVAEEYLVVWLKTPAVGGNTNEVWGRLVSWDGATFGPEFQIASWPNRLFSSPSVAWNSNLDEYLVVWGAQDATTLANLDISSMLLSASGDILTGRNLTTSNEPFDPDVVYNPVTNEYFVVYNTFSVASLTDITAVRVKADNSVINPPGEISIVANNVPEENPAVATNGKFNYAVVWQSWIDSDWDIYGQRVDFNGNKPWNWDSIALTIGTDEMNPDIAFGGQDTYLVTWQRFGFDDPVYYVRAETREYATSTYETFNVASDAILPAVAAGPTEFLVAYQGIYPSGGSEMDHIFGRFLVKMWDVFLPFTQR